MPQRKTADQIVLQIDKPLVGARYGNLDHAGLAPRRDQPVDLRMGEIEPLGNFRLLQPFDKMQYEHRIHLPLLVEVFPDIRHRRNLSFP